MPFEFGRWAPNMLPFNNGEKDGKGWDFGVPDFETDPLSSPVSFCPMNHGDFFPRMWRRDGLASRPCCTVTSRLGSLPANASRLIRWSMVTAVSHAFLWPGGDSGRYWF